jgi:hypothetical protein
MAMTPEKKMKKKVDEVLKEFGVWFFSPQAGIYGRSGVPDRIGILPGGRMIAVEVKAGTKYGLTALQEKTIKEMIAAGAFCWVVKDEESLVGLKAWLRIHGVAKC